MASSSFERRRLDIVLNDYNVDVTVRNIILLILLLEAAGSLKHEEDRLVELLLHVWYSAFLTRDMAALLTHLVLPKLDFVRMLPDSASNAFPHSRTWTIGGHALTACLTYRDWRWFRESVIAIGHIPAVQAQMTRRSVMMAPGREELLDLHLYYRCPSWRRDTLDFRLYGVVGRRSDGTVGFDVPNP